MKTIGLAAALAILLAILAYTFDLLFVDTPQGTPAKAELEHCANWAE